MKSNSNKSCFLWSDLFPKRSERVGEIIPMGKDGEKINRESVNFYFQTQIMLQYAVQLN